jgi:hypothetical protein
MRATETISENHSTYLPIFTLAPAMRLSRWRLKVCYNTYLSGYPVG